MKIIFTLFAVAMILGVSFAEVPEHEPSLDKNCPAGFQWSRGTASCKQADCPEGAGRTYTYECNCGEAWDKPFRTCYDANTPGLAIKCVAAGDKCPGEEPAANDIVGTIANIEGDVECSKDGGKTFTPCQVGTVLRKGDSLSTGFESSANIDFGYGSLKVFQITQFRVDDFSSEQNINKTKLYLLIGSIEPRIQNHTAAIRSDFSVSTGNTAYASIRGSDMIVSYDDSTKLTTVNAVEDVAYVKGIYDQEETTVPQGSLAMVGSDGYVKIQPPQNGNGTPAKFNLPSCCPLFGIVLVGIFTAFIMKNDRGLCST